MTLIESIGIAGFIMLVVFTGLFCLWVCIRLFSLLVGKLENRLPSARK